MNKLLCSIFLCFATLEAVQKEDLLVEHVKSCIEAAEFEISNVSIDVLELEGMSSSKVRHLLNNLCSLPQASYLEIGCWKGSTLVAALYDHEDASAVAIDNWSEFGGPRKEFFSNIVAFLPNADLKVFEADCFAIDKGNVFTKPVNLYFYDGNHDEENQEMAFTYFDEVFDDVFIAMVDDWNAMKVRNGTRSAFSKLGYQILFEKELFTPKNADTSSWWNGIYIAVIKKALPSL